MKYAAMALWALALFLGGGTQVGLTGDMVLEIISVPIILFCILARFGGGRPSQSLVPLCLIMAILALVLVQLVPMPPALSSVFGAHEAINDVLQSAGIEPGWQTISSAPYATVFAAAALLPPIAMFLLVTELGQSKRMQVVLVAIGVAVLTVAIGMQQFSTDSILNATPGDANRGFAVGLFANKNHFSALIYCTIPLCVAWMCELRRSARRNPALAFGVGLSILVVLLVGLNISNSRAGVVLGGVALALSAVMLVSEFGIGFLKSRRSMVIAGILVLAGILTLVGSVALVRDRGAIDETRQVMRAKTIAIIAEEKGRASGFGTFVPVYMAHEDIGDIESFYINHAHNDWLELLLEGGGAVVLVAIAFLAWWGQRSWRIWSAPPGGELGALGKAATISTALLMTHSLLDYPLRTSALLVTFAACCGLMSRPRPESRGASSHSRERRVPSATMTSGMRQVHTRP